MFINKVMLYGNLTRDPELKALQSGSSVCSFSIATNRRWKDKNGEQKEDAQFHNVVAFGKTAELITQYLRKGGGVYIEGRLQTRDWQAKDGTKRKTTEVIAENIQFGARPAGAKAEVRESAQNDAEIDAGGDVTLEDVPF